MGAAKPEARERSVGTREVGRRFPFESSEVRMAADEHGLLHGGGKVIDAVLRQVAAPPGALTRRKRVERIAVVSDRACDRGAQTGERRDERRLAGAVRSDDRPALARPNVEVEVRHE